MKMIDADAIRYEPMLSARGNGQYVDVMVAYKDQIDDLPTIEERKTGKWIEDVKSKRYRCDQCLSFALRTDDGKENLSDFCPVCGSAMEGEQP